MRKRVKAITIDEDIYLHYSVYASDVNLSGLINDYLRFLIDSKRENADTVALEDELAELKRSRVDLDKRAASILSELAIRKRDDELSARRDYDAAISASDTIINSDLLRNI